MLMGWIFEEVASRKNTSDRPLFADALDAVRYLADGLLRPSSIAFGATQAKLSSGSEHQGCLGTGGRCLAA
jgi:hypothetical protein